MASAPAQRAALKKAGITRTERPMVSLAGKTFPMPISESEVLKTSGARYTIHQIYHDSANGWTYRSRYDVNADIAKARVAFGMCHWDEEAAIAHQQALKAFMLVVVDNAIERAISEM